MSEYLLRWCVNPSPTNGGIEGMWSVEAKGEKAREHLQKALGNREGWGAYRFEGADEPVGAFCHCEAEYDYEIVNELVDLGIKKQEVAVLAPVHKMCNPEMIQRLMEDKQWAAMLREADVRWARYLKEEKQHREDAEQRMLDFAEEFLAMLRQSEDATKRGVLN